LASKHGLIKLTSYTLLLVLLMQPVTLEFGNKPIQVVPLLSDKFTEPADYRMCYKAPDYPEWLKAMINEIKELEKMRCWNVVKLSSLPHMVLN